MQNSSSYYRLKISEERIEYLEDLWYECKEKKTIQLIINLLPGPPVGLNQMLSIARFLGLAFTSGQPRGLLTPAQERRLMELWPQEITIRSVIEALSALGPKPTRSTIYKYVDQLDLKRPEGFTGARAHEKNNAANISY